MSDPTQNPPPDDGSNNPPPPPPAQGDYGTGAPPPPPPPPGGWQPGGMPPPVPGAAPGVGQPADLLPRFLARLIDFILVGFVNGILVTALVVGVVMGSDVDSFGTWGGGGFGAGWAASAVSSILSTAITWGYFTWMEANRGQTVGKMLLKLETRGPDGGRPTMEQALKRNAFVAIGLLGIIPVIGFLSGLASLLAVILIAVTIYNNPLTRRGWHDDFAGGTQVVKIG